MIAPAAPPRLPPIPAPPHDPTWYRLDGRAGWRAGALAGVAVRGQALELALVPKSRRRLTEPDGSFGGLVPPANVALAGDGSVYLLDREGLALKRFDPCACAFEDVPCFGVSRGPQREPGAPRGRPDDRTLRGPRAIAVHGATLFIADAGADAGRVMVWTLPELALRSIWTLPPDPPARPNPWRPVAVATDGRGRVWVADPANAAAHRFDRAGRLQRSVGGLGAVRFLAVDCRGRVYVVIDGSDEVQVLDPEGHPLGTVTDPEPLRPFFPALSFAAESGGRLDLRPLCAPDAGAGQAAAGLFDARGNPIPDSEALPGLRFETQGTYLSEPLDARLHRCQWHRVVISGTVPAGARLELATYTAEDPQPLGHVQSLPERAWATHLPVAVAGGEWDGLIRSGPGRHFWLRLTFSGGGETTPSVRSMRIEFPRIGLRRYLPAVWGENPVAADFADRFLALFDTILRSVEHQLDTQARLFDPSSAPAEREPSTGADFLSWLASWIGVSLDRQWPERKRRQLLKRAAAEFPLRGTRAGLWRQLVHFLGMEPEAICCADDQPRSRCVTPETCPQPGRPPCAWAPPPLILEHFQLRRWLFLGAGRLGDQAVLWGQRIVNRSQLGRDHAEEDRVRVGATQLVTTPDPLRDPFHVYAHRFSIFVPAACGRSPGTRRALENLVAAEKPAHTQAQIIYVEPRFRIGFQSSIGLDSVVGRHTEGVELGETALAGAAVLGTGTAGSGAPAPRVGAGARIGSTTVLP